MVLALILTAANAGCGSGAVGDIVAPGGSKLEPDQVGAALDTLPYEVEVRRVRGPAGNSASFAGKAHGPHNTTLEFSIGIGSPPHPLAVPGAGTKHVVWFEEMGFVWNDDGEIASKFDTAAQWNEVARMAAKTVGSLCRAATGEPCPI